MKRPPFFSLASLSRTERQLRALPATRSRTGRERRERDLSDRLVSEARNTSPTLLGQTDSRSREFHCVPHPLQAL